MNKFYVIKMINKRGERGYLVDTPDGIKVSLEAFTSDVAQFGTFEEAKQFIRKRKLENNGCRAWVVSNEDVMNEKPTGIVDEDTLRKREGEVYFLETSDGMKYCYDTRKEQYYFRKCDVGFCIFYEKDLPDLKKEIVAIKKEMNLDVRIRKTSELKKQ